MIYTIGPFSFSSTELVSVVGLVVVLLVWYLIIRYLM